MTYDETPAKHSFEQHDQKRRTVLKTLAAGGVALGGVGFAGSAAAAPPVREETDLTGWTQYNECTDEEMEITRGTRLFLRRREETSGPSGCREHNLLQLNWRGVQAVGVETGRKYQGNYSLQAKLNRDICDPDRAPWTESRIATRTWISQGSAENFVERVRIIFTVNANGDITANREIEDQECR